MLTQNAIATIRGLDDYDKLFYFTVKNFEKKIRDGLIIVDRRDRITDIDDWSRMVFLTNRGMDRLQRGDNEYRAFKSKVKSKRDELKSIKKGKGVTSTRKFASGSGVEIAKQFPKFKEFPSRVSNSSVQSYASNFKHVLVIFLVISHD
jgi:hypothetical protein